jgi:CMP-N-acetylneuraminic acid synthetase
VYLITPAELRATHTFFPDEVVPMVVGDPYENVDIDTSWDWRMAEALIGDLASGT